MFIRIKSFFKGLNENLKFVKKKTLENEIYTQDLMSFIQLFKIFDNEIFFPITRWSMPPREVLNICNDILFNKRLSIVEFGSGYSTIFICKLIQLEKLKVQFYSIDNGLEWQNQIKQKLIDLGLEKFVNFVYAPIVDSPKEISYKNQIKWYETFVLNEQLKLKAPIDLVIVDGPYGGISPFVRYSAIPYLKDKMARNFSVFIDNTDRNDEKQIVKEWQSQIGGKILNYTTYNHLISGGDFVVAPYSVKTK